MAPTSNRGFGPVLTNANFRALWMAQLLAQTSQNATNFVQMVLIEQLTGSTVQLGLIILAFTLPGVIFSPIAGVVVDRFPKKWVLVASNLIRVLLAACYILVLGVMSGGWRLMAIYALTFLTSTISQFFAPAEAATIPLLVGEDRLFAANSLFTLTMAISQVIGLLILGPLAVSLLRVEGGFVIITAMYAGATVLVAALPKDPPAAAPPADALSGWRRLWVEMREGWQFVSGQRRIQIAVMHLVTIGTLVMVIAMLAPGYAARVLGLGPQSAVIVFAPAGLGMLVATGLVGRWGHRLRRLGFENVGLALAGMGFIAMGLVSLDYHRLLQPILHVYPQATLSLTSVIMAIGFVLGICMASVNILAQTIVQEESPAYVRGRVLSVQFMLANLVGIPPMLALGGLADAVGIPRVMVWIGIVTIALTGAIIAFGYIVRKQQPDRA